MSELQAERVRRRFLEVRRQLGCAGADGLRHAVRDVVIIGCSSRGGSSMLAELLRRTPQLLHFRAEVNPFFVLSGLSYPASGTGSDALDRTHATGAAADILDQLLAGDVGVPGDDVDGYAAQVACRLVLQWPLVDFDPPHVIELARDIAAEVDPREHEHRFCVALLQRLRARHPELNPWFYDVSPALIDGEAPPPDGPPGELMVEEPPFVATRPWRTATAEELATRPLIVKTPSNAYRLDFLRAFFPRARFRVLHLRRNAAAAINGLVDGWRYRGFFSHAVPSGMHIAGYSDVFGPWAKRWWKYDLPPGWDEYTHRPLVEVCAFQWTSAHQAVLRFLDAHPGVDVLPLRFEDLVGPPGRREAAYQALADWLGIAIDPPLARALRDGMPPVMATVPPRQRRWFQKAALLDRVLSWPQVRDTMHRLGYDPDPATWD